jgi:hypothetical protein
VVGARTGDPKLMAVVYQLEPEGTEIEINDGPRTIPRTHARCEAEYWVSVRHSETLPKESQFNICQNRIDEKSSKPENVPLASVERKKDLRSNAPQRLGRWRLIQMQVFF